MERRISEDQRISMRDQVLEIRATFTNDLISDLLILIF
jgi:hypothetical protein